MSTGRKEELPLETTKSSLGNVGLWALITLGLILLFRFVAGLDWIGCFIFSVAIGVCGIIITDSSLTRAERGKVGVIFISAFFVIFFWAAFEQAGSSLTLFAERDTDRTFVVNTALGNVVLFVLAIAVFLYYILQRIMQIPREAKTIFGVVGAGALLFAGYHYIQGTPYDQKEIPPSWFNSVNGLFILLLAPFMSQFWLFLNKNRIEPSSPKKQSFGLLFLGLGYLVIAFGVKDAAGGVSMLWLLMLYFLHTMGELCLSPIGLSLVNKLAPARFGSILMGVWFISNAAGSKLAGTLGALYPGEGATSIFGFTITNLYDFFLVFVVISGIAALLLFVLTYWMEKKMGDVR
jgi:POT family proton-dependent oligopeptide transporter